MGLFRTSTLRHTCLPPSTRGCTRKIFFHTSTMILSYKLETSLLGHIDSINALQFSPGGRYLATGGQDGLLFIFSTKTWRLVRKYADTSSLKSLVWHPTFAKTVICGFENGDLITICFDGSQVNSLILLRRHILSLTIIRMQGTKKRGLTTCLILSSALPSTPWVPQSRLDMGRKCR